MRGLGVWSPAVFTAGVLLADEEHEQKDDYLHQLLVAQLKLECQFQHGNGLVYAGSAANWLRVGFGGYECSGRVICGMNSLPPNDVVATTPGIGPGRLGVIRAGQGSQSFTLDVK